MRLLIAIPTLDYVHSEFVRCLTDLIARLNMDRISYEVKIQSGTLVYVARDKLAKYAINNDFTHVLWLDSDVVFGADVLDDLMFSGHDFVSGIYHSRRPPFMATVFRSIDPIDRYTCDTYPAEPFRIAGCGFGCVLVTVAILRQIMLDHKTCFCPFPSYGEDLAFCKRCTDGGIAIYADPSVRLGHIGHITVYPEDSIRYFEQLGGETRGE